MPLEFRPGLRRQWPSPEERAPMNDDDVDEMRQRLFDLRSGLSDLEEASKEAGRPVELDQARVGRLSRMDAMQAQQMAQETARRRQRQLLKIDGALRRIESGEYGHCLGCGEAIDIRRLRADPTNTRCIECADK